MVVLPRFVSTSWQLGRIWRRLLRAHIYWVLFCLGLKSNTHKLEAALWSMTHLLKRGPVGGVYMPGAATAFEMYTHTHIYTYLWHVVHRMWLLHFRFSEDLQGNLSAITASKGSSRNNGEIWSIHHVVELCLLLSRNLWCKHVPIFTFLSPVLFFVVAECPTMNYGQVVWQCVSCNNRNISAGRGCRY